MAELGFLADDLTGASDVLAQAHAFGLDAMLVLDPERSMPADADVVGIAGPARSLSGEALDASIRNGLEALASLGLSVLLYKVCSTFDSSPTTGNIGRAVELLHEKFGGHGSIPVVPAQPGFGRYTAFSNHFGDYAGRSYRLDRHPVMSRHPSTPMTEADLRLVLADQLTNEIEVPGLHLPAYTDGSFESRWKDMRQRRDVLAFVVDATTEEHMDRVASALDHRRSTSHPSLVVGSGGIMAALARTRTGQPPRQPEPTAASGPVLVVSASASAVTATQIDDAFEHGWIDVPIPPDSLASEGPSPDWFSKAESALSSGSNVVAHTTRGPQDPRLRAGRGLSAEQVGRTIGRLVGRMASGGLTRDVVICGGDTSSHVLLALGARELRVTEQFVTAGPICATDDSSAIAGCRLLLKGGQVGPPDVFRRFAGAL